MSAVELDKAIEAADGGELRALLREARSGLDKAEAAIHRANGINYGRSDAA